MSTALAIFSAAGCTGAPADENVGPAAIREQSAREAPPIQRARDEAPGAVAVLSQSEWQSPYRGGRGEARLRASCAPGWVAKGIHGRAGDTIDRIGLVCTFLNANGTFGGEDLRETVGGENGRSFVSTCPDGYAIAGLAGRADQHLDNVGLVCDTLPGTTLFQGNPIGSPVGTPFYDVSPRRYFLTEITVQASLSIDGIWATYYKVDP